jgi:hypothetical protein
MRNPKQRRVQSGDCLWWTLFVLALWPAHVVYSGSAGRAPLQLFSAADAHQLNLTDQEWHRVHRTRSTGAAAGPRIVIQKPTLKESSDGPTIETVTPATARKGFFSKSLTDLLKPYVNGTALQVQDVAIPEGRFRIEIVIADKNGAKTVETYRLQVGQ